VGLGAIVVMGLEREASCLAAPRQADAFLTEPLECFDILGRPMVERVLERFVRAEVDVVSVLVHQKSCSVKPRFVGLENIRVQVVSDLGPAIYQELREFSQNGIEHSFVISGSVYAETDLLDLFYFHREGRQPTTRAIDREGSLNLWVVDCLKAQPTDLRNLVVQAETSGNSYFIREYVNRLADPRDLRRFASDVLRGRCVTRPPGREIKRGIWIDDGAEVYRRARIVAPAYIGRSSKVMADTLITRFSNVEKDCCVDYGTVIEDSSVLQNTHVGICLDVCHAMANGNKLLSLGRNVMVEISDPNIMRANSLPWKPSPAKDRKRAKSGLFSRRKGKPQAVPEVRPAAGSAPEPCRLEPNPIQG
jgi:NDP-sugar pyrophosphorylase family protein